MQKGGKSLEHKSVTEAPYQNENISIHLLREEIELFNDRTRVTRLNHTSSFFSFTCTRKRIENQMGKRELMIRFVASPACFDYNRTQGKKSNFDDTDQHETNRREKSLRLFDNTHKKQLLKLIGL
jgi:hypothetical protein